MRKILTLIVGFTALWLNAQVVDENFNAADGGWTVSSNGGNDLWQYGAPAGTTINDDNGGSGSAWVTGLTGSFTLTGADQVFITSTAYDLSSLSTEGSISVAINLDMVSNDWAYVEYSINSGASWAKLGTAGSGSNWYDNASEEVWTTTANTTGTWVVATQNLPMDALGASSVTFRFVFDTAEPAGTYGGEGFAIDDFQVFNTNVAGGGGGSLPNADFELSDGGWAGSTISGENYWVWGQPMGTQVNDDNSGGGNAWVTGLSGDFAIINNSETMYLTSGAYDLSSLGAEGAVSLALNIDLASGDRAHLEYMINDGMSAWTTLGASGSGINWYDDAVNQAWTMNSGGWTIAAHDLPIGILGAPSVSFRIVIVSAVSTGLYGSEGLAIDDFQIVSTSTGGGSGGGVPGTTQIKTMALSGEIFPAVIDSTSNSVELFVSPSTDVTSLAPTFTLSDGAMVDLTSGSTQNFTSPVTYTVTSGDGMENTAWAVSAVVPDIEISLFPKMGIPGTEIAIYGKGFSAVPSENTVTFGGETVTVLSATANKLTINVPASASLGLNDVTTSTNGISSYTGNYFNVLASGVSGIYGEYKEADFNLNASSIVSAMDVGDLDGDKDFDFVYDDETILKISTLENGRIQSTISKVTDRGNFSSSFADITIVDVDRDGSPDIIAGGSRLGWFKNNGDGTWTDEAIIDQTSFEYNIKVFDIDGDFDFDILVDNGSSVSSFLNNGAGAFTASGKTAPSKLGQPIDWDEDGDIDMLAIGTTSNQIVLATNDGSGNFTDNVLLTAGVSDIDFVQFGDLDNDGDQDLVYTTENFMTTVSTVGYILNNGDGTFSGESVVATEGIFSTKRIELGDLNGDGFLDIARTKSDGADGVFQLYYSSGSLTYSTSETLDSNAGGLDLVLVDIDQDGDMDLLQEASQSGGYFPLFLRLLQETKILSFSMADETGAATIDEVNKSISIEVAATADITALTPIMEISPGASVTPDLGVQSDFTNPVVYTVTPEDPATTGQAWTVTVNQVPSIPILNITTVTIGQESAEATWTVSNSAASGFELELSTVADFSSLVTGFNPLTINLGSDRNVTLSNLSAGTTYYTRLRGVNDLGTFSDFSSPADFLTISGTPVAKLATDVLTESFTANWDAAAGASDYLLEVSVDNFTSTVFSGNTTEIFMAVSGLSTGTTYEYRVSSSNATGASAYSNEITVATNVTPQSLSLDNESVNENQPVGTVVGALSTNDVDDTVHTYELVDGTGGDDNALFAIDGTSLTTNQIFNFESTRQYSVRIKTTDPKSASTASSFVIEILDINDAPSAIAIETSGYSPTGFDPAGTSVADLFITDEDGDNVTFELTQGSESFSVNNTTKVLATAVIFENEVDMVLPVTLKATDPDGASVTESFMITINAFVDMQAPEFDQNVINPTTFLIGANYDSLALKAKVSDFRISEVKLFSRLLTEADFTSTVLIEEQGFYTDSIGEKDLGVAGIEYYFEAMDQEGNTSIWGPRSMVLEFPESGENAPKVESVTKFGRTVDSYQIISIPFFFENPTDKRVDAIFNEYSGDVINREYRIIKWDSSLGTIGELVNLDAASTIELGEGYFFISATERPITIERANINLQDPFPLVLKAGWNLVGNPYNLDINWTSVLDNNSANGIVGPLRVLDTENAETWPESTILKELEGAFVFTSQDITLNISYTDASISFGGGRVASGVREAEWNLPITLEQDGNFRTGGIGMDREAVVSFDKFDQPVLPRWLKFLEISFMHEGEKFERYNRDVVPFSDTKEWEFEVSSSNEGVSTLRWDENSAKVTNLKLYSTKRGEIIDMTKQSSYQFELNGTETFKLLYSTDPDKTFDFEELSTLAAYPNPFTESFRVPLRLPENGADYEVKVNLLDLSGKTIFNGATEFVRSGSFDYTFRKPQGLKSGIYLYKVIIENKGAVNTYTKRIKLQ